MTPSSFLRQLAGPELGPIPLFERLAVSTLRRTLYLDQLRETNAKMRTGPSLNKLVRDLPDLPGMMLDLWASGFCLVDADEFGMVLGMPEVSQP